MDAPKRIWATCHTPLAQSKSGTWHEHPYGEKYILATEHARIVAEKDARIAELSDALRAIANAGQSTVPDHWEFRKKARDVASAAIRAMKGE